jgi:hypothetical protein
MGLDLDLNWRDFITHAVISIGERTMEIHNHALKDWIEVCVKQSKALVNKT